MSRRRKKAKHSTKGTGLEANEQSAAASRPLVANPPRKNLPLLITSSSLLAVWLMALLVMALAT